MKPLNSNSFSLHASLGSVAVVTRSHFLQWNENKLISSVISVLRVSAPARYKTINVLNYKHTYQTINKQPREARPWGGL